VDVLFESERCKLIMEHHTFLFKDAVWEAAGLLTDRNGQEFSVEGISKIKRKSNLWLNDVMLKVPSVPSREVFNFYEILPFNEVDRYTSFQSQTPDLGKIRGQLLLCDDNIFLSFVSEDGKYSGVEHMHRVDEHHYTANGYIYFGTQRHSSWNIQLKRV
jgi:hypothetical protein